MDFIPLRISIASLRSKHDDSTSVKGGAYTRCVVALDWCYIYTANLNPAFNGSSEILHFERSDAIQICDGIMLIFYPELPVTHLPWIGKFSLVKYSFVKFLRCFIFVALAYRKCSFVLIIQCCKFLNDENFPIYGII